MLLKVYLNGFCYSHTLLIVLCFKFYSIYSRDDLNSFICQSIPSRQDALINI